MADKNVKDALDQFRASAQDLNRAIEDATAKTGEALKTEMKVIPGMARAVIDSLKQSSGAQKDTTKRELGEALSSLEAVEKHATESLEASGRAFHAAVTQALFNARACAQHVSAAVAAQRASVSPARPAATAAPRASTHN